MDNLPPTQPQIPQQNDQSTVQIIKKSFWQTKKEITVLATTLGIIIFVILIISLNYFDIIFLPLTSFPKKLVVSCPIQGWDCKINKPVSINDTPAAGYKLPSESKVVSPVKIVDSKQFILHPFTEKDPIGLNQSFILGDICYTITYTVPYDSTIADMGSLPLTSNSQLITLGSQSIKISNEDVNLILQIQKRPVDKNAKTEAQKCPVYNLDPKDFGQFEKIQKDIFR